MEWLIEKVPRMANPQQRRHLRNSHQPWKRHALLGCSTQSQQARLLTANLEQDQ